MRRSVIGSGRLALLAETVAVLCRYRLVQPWRRRPFLPRAVHLIPTHRCNARCVMCGLWQEPKAAEKDLSLADYDRILQDPLMAQLRYVGISGGEPFLRNDLVELVELFRRHCPQLTRVSITTNGILTARIRSALDRLIERMGPAGPLLDVAVSCHAVGDRLSRVYGVEDAFEAVKGTLEILKEYRRSGFLTFSLNAVLLKVNLDGARDLAEWADAGDIPLSFVVGEQRDRFHNAEMDDVFVGPEEKAPLMDFLRERCRAKGGPLAVRYDELLNVLAGKAERTLVCYYALGGFVLGRDGSMYYCSHSRLIGNCRDRSAHDVFYDPENLTYRRSLLDDACRQCPPYTMTRWEMQANAHRILWRFVVRGMGRKASRRSL